MTLARVTLGLAFWLAMLVPAQAQTSLGGNVYGTFGGVNLAASDTFKAVADTDRAPSWGVGGQVTRLWRQLFVDVSYSRQWLDGQRVFVQGGNVYPLGIPLKIRFEPIDAAAGWRFPGRFIPYFAAGATWIKYTETSDFAQTGDDVDARKAGALVLGGVDVPFGRWLLVGGELRYRAVTGVLGESGASQLFGEDQLGGISYALRVSVGR